MKGECAMSIVTVRKVEEYNEEALYAAISAQFEALEVAKELTPDTKVLLKPNLLAPRAPETATTTHPLVLRAVARWLRERGIKQITLADSSGGMYALGSLNKLYTACGLDGLSDVLTLNRDVSWGNRGGFSLLKPVLDADYIIDCAKLKTHGLTTMTGCVKNLFGCIPGLKKPETHCLKPTVDSFCRFLLALCQEVKPDLCVLDAVDCMEGNGPGGGDIRHMGYLLCSRSPYAIDEQGAILMGLNPLLPPLNRLARKAGLLAGQTEVTGDALIPASPPFVLPDAQRNLENPLSPNGLFHRFLARRGRRPHVDRDKCVGCGKCAESCPQKLITIQNCKAVMVSKGCIACYCCQEMCPAHAIIVGKPTR